MTELKIIDSHECIMANERQAIQILHYEQEGWTLFADHSRMIRDDDDDIEYYLAISFCPFCGENLYDNYVKP